MKKNRSKRICAIVGVFIVVLMLGISLSTSSHALTTTHYNLPSSTISSLRIVQLTDLHNSEFGENNARLVSIVRDQSPDLILLTGDLLNSDEQRTDIATDLIAQLCDIAPVYFSNGNHEIEYLSGVCNSCQNSSICHSCAAMAMAETGRFDGIPIYMCEMVKTMKKFAQEQLKIYGAE